MTEFVRDRVLTARRDETCPECRSLIPRGTRYTRESQRENGRTYNAILCQPCKAFAGRYLASMQLCSAINADEVTFQYGSLLDEAAEYLGHEPKPGQTLPDLRDILIAQFDACDVAERAEQARERALRQQAKARRPETTMAGVPGFPSAGGMA